MTQRADQPVAIITGAGSGIGAAVAKSLATSGWRLVLTGRRSAPLHATAEGVDALVMPGDVPNMSVSFESKGSSMLSALAECVKQNEKKFKNFKPSLEKVPDAVKEQL